MYYVLVVAVVDGLGQLEHNFEDFFFGHPSILESLPVVVQFTTRQKLHNHDKLLLFWLWKRVNQFYYVLVLQVAQRFHFFF